MYQIAVLGGDGIGPEVTAVAVEALRQAGLEFAEVPFRLGAERYIEVGVVLPDDELAKLKATDAILLGAVGGKPNDPRIPPGLVERELLLRLRFDLDHYINLRPFESPDRSLDLVFVREGTEGSYAGEGGVLRKNTPFEIATQGSVNTRHGVERCVRYAFALAEKRSRRHLTLVHKTNVLSFAGDLWNRTFVEVANEYPQVETAYCHVDAACIFLHDDPRRFDTVVTDNLFGDILTDLAGAVTGGIGLAASGNLNPDRTFPSMFEPVHGSAPDIAGQNKANPLAAVKSAAMMAEFLGEASVAERLTKAVRATAAEIGSALQTTSEIRNRLQSHLGRN